MTLPTYMKRFFYPQATVTRTAPHVLQSLDLRRYSFLIILAVLPCVLAAVLNTGYQANSAITGLGMATLPDWRGSIMTFLGMGHDPASLWSDLGLGLLYFLPLFIISVVVALFWNIVFAVMRKEESNEGAVLTALLFTLTLPAGTPIWQAAIGITFGIVIGKEIFGGNGMNIVNPVLAGRAFLYFTYPEQISGTEIWTAVDGFSGATPLAIAKSEGIQAFLSQGLSWNQAFLGQMQGSLGETSALACLIGGAFLLYTGLISWRVISGIMIGMIGTTLLFNWAGSDSNPMFSLSWHWHLVLGGFAFGMVFLATDPVTSSVTDSGRWIYGMLIGALVIIIRITNPVSPEGMMFAILLANLFAPLIDYVVIQIHIKHRQAYLNKARYFPQP